MRIALEQYRAPTEHQGGYEHTDSALDYDTQDGTSRGQVTRLLDESAQERRRAVRGPNRFLFVVSRLDYGSHTLLPEAIFDALTAHSLWLLAQRTPHRKRMAPDDHIIFYFAGNKRRHFVADAVISGEPRPFTPEEARFTRELGVLDFDLALDLASIRRWKSPAPIAPLYDALTFIKDKRYPGHQLRSGTVRLSDQDYKTIMAERT